MLYYIWIIYEDGTIYQSKISSKNDIVKIPRSKSYECVRIFYPNFNYKYSHVLYGQDYIYINYSNKIIRVAQFNQHDKTIDLLELKGIGKESTIRSKIPIDKLRLQSNKNIILTGKQIPDAKYYQMRQLCHSITVNNKDNR